MNIEVDKFNEEVKLMKDSMNDYEKRLYGIVSNNVADKNDLDILLTLVFVSGKTKGIEISRETIKGYCDENNISLD